MSFKDNTAKNCDAGIQLEGELVGGLTSEPSFLISDKTFQNETVDLDFCRYERCTFLKCKLHVKYGNFRFIDCDIEHCELSLELPALGVAALLKAYFKDQPIEFKDESKVIQ